MPDEDPMLTKKDHEFRKSCLRIMGLVCQSWKQHRKVFDAVLFEDLIAECASIVGEIDGDKTLDLVRSVDKTITEIRTSLKSGELYVWPAIDELFFELEYIWSWTRGDGG